MPYTETMLRLMSAMDPIERRVLDASAHIPGRRVRARLGSAADRFWINAATLGWAERGEPEVIGGQRTRRYRISPMGAKALPVLLIRNEETEAVLSARRATALAARAHPVAFRRAT